MRRVDIPKADGGTRPLGIPTVADRVAQEVARRYLEPRLEPVFHADSYGYRPGKSAIDAVRQARQRCWRYDWVLDLDVKASFDSIDWELMLRAVRRHTNQPWVLLGTDPALAESPAPTGRRERRAANVGNSAGRRRKPPPGQPIPALCVRHVDGENFSHVPFSDMRMMPLVTARAPPRRGRAGARAGRLGACRLLLHPEKTRIVYCKTTARGGGDFASHTAFDFLGYGFRPSEGPGKGDGSLFVRGFLPAISSKAKQKPIRGTGSGAGT